MGAYAEYVSVAGQFVHKLPDGADLSRALLCEPLAAVLKGLNKLDRLVSQFGEPPRFAIVGAGPIGHLCARVLSTREYPVAVFDRNPDRLRYFEDTPISTSSDLSDLGQFQVLVEATGDPEVLKRMLEGSNAGATVLLLGLPYSRRQFTVEGGTVWDKSMIWSGGAEPTDFQEAIRLLPQLSMDGLTERVLPLSQFSEAWESFRQGDHLKVLIKVS